MAIEEHDREDLLRDGRTMPLRGQCVIEGISVMIGFRAEGQLSLYCGPDPVFQFNANVELRRVYFEGKRYAADQGMLVELTRETRGGKVQFKPAPIDHATQSAVLSSIQGWINEIQQALQSSTTQWQVIEDEPSQFLERLHDWFKQLPNEPVIANSANV